MAKERFISTKKICYYYREVVTAKLVYSIQNEMIDLRHAILFCNIKVLFLVDGRLFSFEDGIFFNKTLTDEKLSSNYFLLYKYF